MKLYGYWRSSATYRVRIALALKGLDYDYAPVNLLKGEQKSEAYLKKNPLGLVPSLKTDDGAVLTQSLAIIEWLEETHPETPLLPESPVLRATARAMAATIASEAQPLMNLRIQNYLKNEGGFDEASMKDWLNAWPGGAMAAVEAMAERTAGDYLIGDVPGYADCFLVPQMFAAKRFGMDLTRFPTLVRVDEKCRTHPAFEKAHPEKQVDAA